GGARLHPAARRREDLSAPHRDDGRPASGVLSGRGLPPGFRQTQPDVSVRRLQRSSEAAAPETGIPRIAEAVVIQRDGSFRRGGTSPSKSELDGQLLDLECPRSPWRANAGPDSRDWCAECRRVAWRRARLAADDR